MILEMNSNRTFYLKAVIALLFSLQIFVVDLSATEGGVDDFVDGIPLPSTPPTIEPIVKKKDIPSNKHWYDAVGALPLEEYSKLVGEALLRRETVEFAGKSRKVSIKFLLNVFLLKSRDETIQADILTVQAPGFPLGATEGWFQKYIKTGIIIESAVRAALKRTKDAELRNFYKQGLEELHSGSQ